MRLRKCRFEYFLVYQTPLKKGENNGKKYRDEL